MIRKQYIRHNKFPHFYKQRRQIGPILTCREFLARSPGAGAANEGESSANKVMGSKVLNFIFYFRG